MARGQKPVSGTEYAEHRGTGPQTPIEQPMDFDLMLRTLGELAKKVDALVLVNEGSDVYAKDGKPRVSVERTAELTRQAQVYRRGFGLTTSSTLALSVVSLVLYAYIRGFQAREDDIEAQDAKIVDVQKQVDSQKQQRADDRRALGSAQQNLRTALMRTLELEQLRADYTANVITAALSRKKVPEKPLELIQAEAAAKAALRRAEPSPVPTPKPFDDDLRAVPIALPDDEPF